MIFSPQYECMSDGERQRLQYARLKNLIEKLYERVPFYR